MADDLKKIAKRFFDEIMVKGDVGVIDEIIDDSFVEHQEFPGMEPGKAGLVQFVESTRAGVSGLAIDVISMVAEGDEVWIQSLTKGKHTGDWIGIPATGKEFSFETFDRVKVKNGKAVEHWGVSDDMGLMTQLGLVPEIG